MREELIAERALHQHIRRHTVRLLDFTDKSAGGSAVTVKLGNRYFLATAAHVIPPSHDIRILVGESKDDNVGRFLARHVDKMNDVGVLEVDEEIATQIDREFTDSGQLSPQLDQRSGWPATLVGYPTQSIVTEESCIGRILHRTHSFATLTLVTETIPFRKWPEALHFARRSPRRQVDIFVRFDPKGPLYQQNLGDVGSHDVAADAAEVQLFGMSGCGIWLDGAFAENVWRPMPTLIGIDTGAFPKQGWARGTQIAQWLRLVIRHYREFDVLLKHLSSRRKSTSHDL